MHEIIILIESTAETKKRVAEALPESKIFFTKETGSAVLAMASRHKPDVILMDVHTPGLSGMEMLGFLRLSPETRDIPIICLSAASEVVGDFDPSLAWVVTPEDSEGLRGAVRAAVAEAYIGRTVRDAIVQATMPSVDDTSDLTQSELDVLLRGGFDPHAEMNLEPIATRAAEYSALLASSSTVHEAAKRLGVTDSRVRQRLGERSLYGILTGKKWRLPAFQFSGNELVPNVERVIARLSHSLDPVTVEGWFKRPNVDLEQDDRNISPLEWLAQGNDWRPVAELAEDL